MDESKLDREGFSELCSIVTHGLHLWGAFVDAFSAEVLDFPFLDL